MQAPSCYRGAIDISSVVVGRSLAFEHVLARFQGFLDVFCQRPRPQFGSFANEQTPTGRRSATHQCRNIPPRKGADIQAQAHNDLQFQFTDNDWRLQRTYPPSWIQPNKANIETRGTTSLPSVRLPKRANRHDDCWRTYAVALESGRLERAGGEKRVVGFVGRPPSVRHSSLLGPRGSISFAVSAVVAPFLLCVVVAVPLPRGLVG